MVGLIVAAPMIGSSPRAHLHRPGVNRLARTARFAILRQPYAAFIASMGEPGAAIPTFGRTVKVLRPSALAS